MAQDGTLLGAFDAQWSPPPKVKPRRKRRKRKTYTWQVQVYTASWCLPWPQLDKALTLWEGENPQVQVKRIDVDEHPQKADANQIVTLPTIVIMRDGVERQRFLGAVNMDDLTQAVK